MILARRGRFVTGGLVLGVIGACSQDPPPPPAAQPTTTEGQPVEAPAAPPQESTELLREVYSYRGANRDPFRSLISTNDASLRPFFDDLRVVAIQFDPNFPARSVAMIRDTTLNDRYSVKAGDRLGRLAVLEIRRGEIVFSRENLGVTEQVVLRTRRRGQGGIR